MQRHGLPVRCRRNTSIERGKFGPGLLVRGFPCQLAPILLTISITRQSQYLLSSFSFEHSLGRLHPLRAGYCQRINIREVKRLPTLERQVIMASSGADSGIPTSRVRVYLCLLSIPVLTGPTPTTD